MKVMSVAEMKKAIHEKIEILNNEAALKEVLEHIEKLNQDKKKVYNLAQHYPEISRQFDETLKKLAQ